jgi:uncharacterized repeat protein (TIGR03803 family)
MPRTSSHRKLSKSLFVLAITMVFVSVAGAKAKEKTIHRFNYKEGAYPASDLILDNQGNLYGTTNAGGEAGSGCGDSGCGAVFELSPSAGGGWTYSVLYAFKGGTDSGNPSSRLIFDDKGNLYGAAGIGGADAYGTIFELTPGSHGTWTESILHSFPSNTNDGFTPAGDLAFDAKGNLYGSTLDGLGGAVYELTPEKDGSWSEAIIYHFDHGENDGFGVYGGVALDKQGNVYGATYLGNEKLHSKGTVFEISPGSHGGWNERVIHNFLGIHDGAAPRSPITIDSTGSLYGSTLAGGPDDGGTIFELIAGPGGKWQDRRVRNFTFDSSIGPPGRVVFDSNGDILGTSDGGTYGAGSVWQLTPRSGGGWSGKVLYSFKGGGDGSRPVGVVIGKNGHLYGTTQSGGGRYGYGTVFEIIP